MDWYEGDIFPCLQGCIEAEVVALCTKTFWHQKQTLERRLFTNLEGYDSGQLMAMRLCMCLIILHKVTLCLLF